MIQITVGSFRRTFRGCGSIFETAIMWESVKNLARTKTACDICGSEREEILFVKEGFPHVRCLDCRMVFVNPRLTDHQEIQRKMGTGELGEQKLSQKYQKWLQKEIHHLEGFRVTNQVLDVGAGFGWFLEQASNAEWNTSAVEVNKTAIQMLHQKKIHHIVTEPAERIDFPEATFDVVRIWDVIEHCESPRLVLERIRNVLRPGGLLKLSTTNFASLSRWINGPEWVYLNGVDHIFLFEPKTIRFLLESLGFGNIQIHTTGYKPERVLHVENRRLPPPLPFIYPLRNLIHGLIRITPWGHSMTVQAFKK